MARKKGGLLKGVAAAAASYAAKAAVDFAKNPENMQKMAQFVNDQQIGDKLKQVAANVHMPVALDPAAKVAKQLDTIETTLEQYADQFPVDAPIGQWKNTLKNLRLMNTMNKNAPGSERKARLKRLQSQTEALSSEIIQSLDPDDAQIED